jgi:hypothetical protein
MLCSISFNAPQIQWYLVFDGLSYITLLLIGAYRGFLQNQKRKRKRNIQPLILGAKAFVHAAKKNVTFVIYTTPIGTSTKTGIQEIPMQYHDFKHVFEKKNVDITRAPCV